METKIDFAQLTEKALGVAQHRELSSYTEVGSVGAALLTESGSVYVGCNIDTACSMGFCAEHAAAAAMVTAGESRVIAMVAVNHRGVLVPPCGRCRQFIAQLHDQNQEAQVLIGPGQIYTLSQLLPFDWRLAHPKE